MEYLQIPVDNPLVFNQRSITALNRAVSMNSGSLHWRTFSFLRFCASVFLRGFMLLIERLGFDDKFLPCNPTSFKKI